MKKQGCRGNVGAVSAPSAPSAGAAADGAFPLYVSTRDSSQTAVSFRTAILRGIAPDGGLYLPSFVPRIDEATARAWAELPYAALVAEIACRFIDPAQLPPEAVRAVAAAAYGPAAGWRSPRCVEFAELGPGDVLMELFHGPTFAFKDFALQFLARLMRALLARGGGGGDASRASEGRGDAASIPAPTPAPAPESGRSNEGKGLGAATAESSAGGQEESKCAVAGAERCTKEPLCTKKPSLPLTIIGATSGDTGSAAMAAFGSGDCEVPVKAEGESDSPGGKPDAAAENNSLRCAILFPLGGVSEIQALQMNALILPPRVTCLAVAGATFDDCQTLVKNLLRTGPGRLRTRLSTANSINWGRILAQIAYYWFACLQLKKKAGTASAAPPPAPAAPVDFVDFCVPTGNFGNILSAYFAKRMGAPVGWLVAATNHNDVLARTFASGLHEPRPVRPSAAVAMDISRSSNFERLVRLLPAVAPELVAAEFGSPDQRFQLLPPALAALREDFFIAAAAEEEIAAATRAEFARSGRLLDPHTAAARHVAEQFKKTATAGASGAAGASRPLVTVATAHPGKFLPAIQKMMAAHPPLLPPAEVEQRFMPPQLRALRGREIRWREVDNSQEAVREALEQWLERPDATE